MPLYKIADIIVEMPQQYKETESWYEPYLYNGEEAPEFQIEVPQRELEYFVREGVDITPPISENICLCNRFNLQLIKYRGSYIHSSAVLYKGKVYLFSASSGVGKSTLTSRICRIFPEAVVINDDKPSFRLIDGKCIVYGTPFAGGTSIQTNLKGELGAVIFVERSDENKFAPISSSQAITSLLQQVRLTKREEIVDRLLSMFSDIIENYPFYSFGCTNSDDAAYEVIKIMDQDQ